LRHASIDEATVLSLNETHEADDVKRLLEAKLGINLDGLLTPDQLEVTIDFYFYSFAFCKELGFNTAKTSAFLSIIKTVFDLDCSTNSPARTMKTSFEGFKDLLLAHAVERSPRTVGIFSVDDVARIVEYMLNSYFRHYRLYKYIFTKKLAVTLVQTSPHLVDAPSVPKPLAESVLQDEPW